MVEQKLAGSVDKVYALLTDPKWIEARCLALGELSASCKVKKTPTMVVTMKRRVRRELNAVISRVLNPESDIELEERWAAEGKGHKGRSLLGRPSRAVPTNSATWPTT